MKNQILWTACVTPFNQSSDQIDFVSFENILRQQAKHKNGIVILGSTGEGLSLTDSERRQLVDFTISLKLDTPIMVGVPSTNLFNALEWITFCNSLPISGYLMPTPLYTKPGIMGQTAWFEKLLDAASHPCMLYNIPSRTGIKLHSETVKNISAHKQFYAIKDSSGGVEMAMAYQNSASHIDIYCGDDYLMPVMAISGAVGLVSIASNVFPSATRKYVRLCLQNEILSPNIWWQASQVFTMASNPIPVKALLHQLGMIAHPTVRLPLSSSDLTSQESLRNVNDVIMQWEAGYV